MPTPGVGVDDVVPALTLLVDSFLDDQESGHVTVSLVETAAELVGRPAGVVLVLEDGALLVGHCTDPCVERLLDVQVDVLRLEPPPAAARVTPSARLDPRTAVVAQAMGVSALVTVPLESRGQVLGLLILVWTDAEPTSTDLGLATALADVAAVGIVTQRSLGTTRLLSAQLQHALSSRVVIEEAKGILAGLGDLAMVDAFVALRRWARDHRMPLATAAQRVVDDRSLSADVLATAPGRPT
ncbi:MAG: GAF and ANTAR domain-containing protein [Nocardioidaceae bacterium]|nr:GAF and ANTAR domain-containing protein [Nocardioidaceae bacterium]NUS51292.1 GAF and ANTAR domain-containing protein [Nocardioidaceae bacterium]